MALAVYIAFDFVLSRNKERGQSIYRIDDQGEKVYLKPKVSEGLNLVQKFLVIGAAIIYAVLIGLARIIEKVDTVN